jgi:hypothetical protein
VSLAPDGYCFSFGARNALGTIWAPAQISWLKNRDPAHWRVGTVVLAGDFTALCGEPKGCVRRSIAMESAGVPAAQAVVRGAAPAFLCVFGAAGSAVAVQFSASD